MPSAEIITIGTEILLGEIVDTNARYLARLLRDIGVDLYRKTTVGDNPQRIAQAVQDCLERSDIVITTGGLGPTVDDPTRQGVALAVGVQTEFRPDLWEQIQARFRRFHRQPTDNNRRQAYVPQGAIAVENPVGTAPAFILEHQGRSIIALPGVPREMEYLMQNAVLPYLRQKFGLTGIIKARVLHTAGAGESQIDDLIGDLETSSNPTVGLAAHSGQVDVRITAKADSEAAADALIQPLELAIRQRLGNWVYGADQDTLEGVALRLLEQYGWSLVVVEAGLSGSLLRRLASTSGPFLGGEILTETPSPQDLLAFTDAYRQARGAEVGLGVAIYPGLEQQDVRLVLITPDSARQFTRPYGGPPEYAPRWALHHSLDLIRTIPIPAASTKKVNQVSEATE
ncbi:MAG TPA: CinA family nicotinamide mononucleotide deamidase-related protein [Anaerolineales bacterium]|nr:CinA family nicotinamide mononucleotide deamidase-related protein [Anaerolineales bacterium]